MITKQQQLVIFGLFIAMHLLIGCGEESREITEDPIEVDETAEVNEVDETNENSWESPSACLVDRVVSINGSVVEFNKSNQVRPKRKVRRFVSRLLHRGVLRMLVTNTKQQPALSCDHLRGFWAFLCRLLNRVIQYGWGLNKYDVSKVLVSISGIDIKTGDTWSPVSTYTEPRVVDLVSMQDGTFLDVGAFDLDPGIYDGIRLVLAENHQIEVSEGLFGSASIKPMTMIPEDRTTIDIVGDDPFEVSTLGVTTLQVDFDLKTSVIRNGPSSNRRYRLNPHLTLIGSHTDESVSKTISAADGGTLEILGDISVTFPANALEQDTLISIKPVYDLSIHTDPDLMIMGHEYEILPADIQFLKPVDVTVHYLPVYVPALDLQEDGIDLHTFSDEWNSWGATSALLQVEDNLVSGEITAPGKLAVGGTPYGDAFEGESCGFLGGISPEPKHNGIDRNLFNSQCDALSVCNEHGSRTYGKTSNDCIADFADNMATQCESLCSSNDLFSKDCSDLTPEELAEAGEMKLGELYTTCNELAQNLSDKAIALGGVLFKSDESTCNDYDELGVSCEAPTCFLTVDREEITIGQESDLEFTLSVEGSIAEVTFDGTTAYLHDGLATPIQETITINDSGHQLTEDKTFIAVITGPSDDAPISCEVTVTVIESEPCTLTIDPDSVSLGDPRPTLNLLVKEEYATIFMDLRTENSFTQITLENPDEFGYLHLITGVRVSSSRTFHAKVSNEAGDEFTCSDDVVFIP